MNDPSDLRGVDQQPSAILRYWPAWAALALAALVVALVPISPSGCSVDPERNIAQSERASETAQPIDDLELARGALEAIPADPQAIGRALTYLNKWVRQQDDFAVDEKLDPLLDQVPKSYQGQGWPDQFHSRYIDIGDVLFLMECSWLKVVADRVAARPISDERRQWLLAQEKTLGIENAAKLELADRLFDWTVRHVQLDPLPPPPAPPKAMAQTNDPAAALASLPGPVRGEVGPGYAHPPWQTVVHGHGDAWERARVFILLARQAGLDVVMLAVPETQGTGGNRPWLPALLLNDQLYLFDTALGLPIPGPDGNPVATLEQVVADPGLLESLDLPGVAEYPISAADMTAITALIDGQLPALSVRMRLLEPVLSDKGKLVLTCRPSEIAGRVRNCKHISGASLWRVAIEAEMYRLALSNPLVLQSDPARFQKLFREHLPLGFGQPLLYARDLQLHGRLNTPPEEEQQLGALERYSQMRPSDKQIEALNSAEGRRAVGIDKFITLPTDKAEREQALAGVIESTRLVKHHSTYWIALAHYEAGQYEVAVEWLRDRVIAGAPDSPWQNGARYNLARAYEALGRWRDAQQTLASDESPQRHGNLLRAIQIGRRHESESAGQSDSSAAAEEGG